MTNTKIKTLWNKVNTENKNWEWDKYWIKTNTAADSNVNSNSASKDWIVLTVEDERLSRKLKKKSPRLESDIIKFFIGDLKLSLLK